MAKFQAMYDEFIEEKKEKPKTIQNQAFKSKRIKENKIQMSIRIEPSLINALDIKADELGLDRSQVIRMAVKEFLK